MNFPVLLSQHRLAQGYLTVLIGTLALVSCAQEAKDPAVVKITGPTMGTVVKNIQSPSR